MFRPVESFDLVALEHRVLTRWREGDVFAESLRRREGRPEWVFYEGPPTANGRPGIHHVWARLFKDIYPRFRTMQGNYVARKGGWDCHGLPVEVEIERELGLTNKHQIEDFGIEAFNQRCRESVHRYVEDWGTLTGRIGMWLDTANAYWTLSNEYIETVWWLFHRLWDQGDIYEGDKVVPYCGRCGTALSSHELGQPGAYVDVTEPSVYVRFPVVDRDFDLLVWTTTPWTLISNVAAAVGPDVDYARMRDPQGGRDLVLAAARVGDVFGDAVLGGAEVVGKVEAADLVGLHYERPFTILPIEPGANRVVAADFVTVDDGSGIVHLAPAFGEVDREVAAREGLPVLNPVGPDARFDASVPEYRGMFVKDADPAIVADLRERGLLTTVIDYAHSYPHCWRCDTPLIYWAKPTWFARTAVHKAELLRENETVGWHPEHIKHGRFGDWLENNVDWALSRDRYWGTPIPVWRCRDPECGADTCVESVAELSKLAGSDLSELDLHRPFVDDIAIACPDCGGRAFRVEPVLDAWFDSGSMPAAQFHYPFENSDVFERRFPADFICEAIDQTRGWFYSLLAVNTLVFGHTPYRNVVCLGLLLDQDGFKMSKSRGNVIDPRTILESQGADALRWNMFSAAAPWSARRLNVESIDESTRRFLLTLWNTYSFFVTYARLDNWEPSTAGAAESRGGSAGAVTHVLDRWILSRLEETIATVTDGLEAFDAMAGAQALERFVGDLSNWYVRRSRSRFWKSADEIAHATLHECLLTVSLLLAPYCPFVTDEMHANLASSADSVHLSDWPASNDSRRDPGLDAEMELARQVTSLGRSARNDARIGVRQPLPRAYVLLPASATLRDEVVAEVAAELNVKRVEVVASLDGLLDYRVVPNFKALGPRLGKRLPRVRELLLGLDGADVRRALAADGTYTLDVEGEPVVLGPDDLVVRAQQHEDLTLAQDGDLAVALDLTLDDELRAEGTARELVRLVNDTRKAIGLDLADRIVLRIAADGRVGDAARRHQTWIAEEVLAVELTVGGAGDSLGSADAAATIDGEPVSIAVERT
ncbi:MAG: isoleucyl-tRNA synthetase [Actinomycetota bacterium]|nr:isoleucyl-tRNA synthetase [Actinomycetota bacterium]